MFLKYHSGAALSMDLYHSLFSCDGGCRLLKSHGAVDFGPELEYFLDFDEKIDPAVQSCEQRVLFLLGSAEISYLDKEISPPVPKKKSPTFRLVAVDLRTKKLLMHVAVR
ncbi:unnamed protein product [Gongylonema pulchrum]|uniref:BTB domain-containing protein n=1 Tax=Gongylonema pulchrum TaxID=637853 RepID=A0A183E581_9BILA|nr:unnamed protein product [Gongylonema pulchrum]